MSVTKHDSLCDERCPSEHPWGAPVMWVLGGRRLNSGPGRLWLKDLKRRKDRVIKVGGRGEIRLTAWAGQGWNRLHSSPR